MAVSFLHGLTYIYIEMHISGSNNHIDFACMYVIVMVIDTH